MITTTRITHTTPSLFLSLLFGVGQIVVGAALVLSAASRQRWRRPGIFVASLAGAWFVCSGIAELIVSGMETLRAYTGAPSTAIFTLWRGRADMALTIATVVLVALGVLYAVFWRWLLRPPHGTGPAQSAS